MIHYDQYRLKEEKIRPDRNLRPVVLLCVVYCIELSETKTNWNKLLLSFHINSLYRNYNSQFWWLTARVSLNPPQISQKRLNLEINVEIIYTCMIWNTSTSYFSVNDPWYICCHIHEPGKYIISEHLFVIMYLQIY